MKELEKNTISSLLKKRKDEFGEKIFLYFEEKEYSYIEIDDISERISKSLVNRGIQKGDRVAILFPNLPEFIFSFLGIMKAGGISVPVNPMLKPPEIEFILNNCEAKILIAHASFLPQINEIKKNLTFIKEVYISGDKGEDWTKSYQELLEPSSDIKLLDVELDDSASIIYTSGTTGKPKGAILSHYNYVFNAWELAVRAEMTPSDRFLCILPLFHVNAQVVTLFAPLYAGGSMILLRGFSPKTFLGEVAKYKASAFSAVPTVYAILNTLPSSDYDLSNLRFCICGAAPMPVEVFETFEKKFNARILEGYGLSEGTCASSANLLSKRKIGSIGVPLEGQEMIIIDDKGEKLPAEKIGEIAIRGDNVMKGYFKNRTATGEVLSEDGWLRTGDLGYYDEDGFFFIVGRKKEMIIRGGENIYPKEIEEVLYKHPSIQEAAVIGIPDKVWGEEVGVVLSLKEGEELKKEDIMKYLKERVADYKIPKKTDYIKFMKTLPKTATGKIQKHVIIEKWNEI